MENPKKKFASKEVKNASTSKTSSAVSSSAASSSMPSTSLSVSTLSSVSFTGPKILSDSTEFRPPVPSLLDSMPLSKMLQIDREYPSWSDLKTAALRRRRQLIIADSECEWFILPIISSKILTLVENDDDNSPFYEFAKINVDQHALYCDKMTPEMVSKVTQSLPSLTVLRIDQWGTPTELRLINQLLKHYAHQLEEVNVKFMHDETRKTPGQINKEEMQIDVQRAFTSLFDTLNQMTALKTLMLDLSAGGLQIPIEIDLSVARQLKVLYVETDNFNGTIFDPDIDLLKAIYEEHCEGNEALQALYCSNQMTLNTLLSFGPRVKAALRMVKIADEDEGGRLADFHQFAQQCPHVENLCISETVLSNVAQMAEALVPCQSLVHLSLCLNLANGILNPVKKRQLLPVLPSVKSLRLFLMATESHNSLKKLKLDVIFPNLQVMEIRHRFKSCTKCNFYVPNEIQELSAELHTVYSTQVHECARWTRLFLFTRFPKLNHLNAFVDVPNLDSSHYAGGEFTRKTMDQMTTWKK